MEGLASNKELKTSTSSSSGCSSSSSTTDIKKYHHNTKFSNTNRSRSFLHCLSKHLGKHFLQQQHSSLSTSLTSSTSDNHNNNNNDSDNHHHHYHHSQDDLRSSSTDSFSLSYERNSRSDCETRNLKCHSDGRGVSAENVAFNFNIDLNERDGGTSRSLSASAYSPHNHENENEQFYNSANMYRYSQRHFYLDTNLYTRSSTLNCNNDEVDLSETDSGNLSSTSNETDKQQRHHYHQQSQSQKLKNIKKDLPMYNVLPEYPLTDSHNRSKSDGFHLSKISITSSVRNILQHFSTGQISTIRSAHSCHTTPSKRSWNMKCKKNCPITHQNCTNSNNDNVCNNSSNNKLHASSMNLAPKTKTKSKAKATAAATATISATTPTTATAKSNKKKSEKKQHSILRPPINYVHMKGISGLYSRVPRYTVCGPYGNQQWT